MRSSAWWCVVVVAAGGLAGCGSQEKSCDSVSFPAPPSGVDDLLFVARPCDGDLADGTRERPFSSINDAIAKAGSGATILVASDTEYPEDVWIDKPLSLIASPPESIAAEAAATIRATTGPSIMVAPGVTGVLVRGFVLERGKGVGAWIQGGAGAKLEGLLVANTETDGDGNFGYGILATDGGSVDIVRTDIKDTRNVGIHIAGGRATMTSVHVSGVLEHGGIRVEGAQGNVTFDDVTIEACTELGILVSNSKATMKATTVLNISEGETGIGDGIVVRRRKNAEGVYPGGAEVDIDGAIVTGVARVGVVFSEGATGTLTNSNINGNGVDPIWSAGVWIQSGAGGDTGIVLSKNKIRENKYNGIGLTSGAFAKIVDGNEIIGTKADTLPLSMTDTFVGQGIGVFGGARAQIESNRVVSNAVIGVFMDNPGAGTTLEMNDIQYNETVGLLIQHATNGIPPFAKNNFEGNNAGPTLILGEAEASFPYDDSDISTP